MKILLIYPYCIENRYQEEDAGTIPIGLYYIGAMLKEHDYDVEILNLHHFRKNPEKIKKILEENPADIIGFSVVNANRWGAIDIARMAKEINPDVKTVFGGTGATFLWEHLLTHFNKDIDYIVIGEGEQTFLNLANGISKQNQEMVENISGIAFYKNGSAIKTKPADPIADIDSLPSPARYFKFAHLCLTRGCPSDCSFCGSPGIWGRKVRFHSPEYFVNQMETLYQKGVRFFYVSDDTFTLKKDIVIQLCKDIIERDLKVNWAAISRVDCVDENVLYWMRKAGCIQISYGVESGNERIRRILNKQITSEQIEKAFALTVEHGIMPRAYFIYGCPEETDETIAETIELMLKIKPLGAIFYILDIFPGTRLYEEYKKQTGANDDIWLERIEDIMYFQTDPKLDQDMILDFGKKLRSAFYKNLSSFVEDIKFKDIPEFKELYADFLSRLGMTFSLGDYAKIEDIKDKESVAMSLFKKALSYAPDHRAFLGLGIISQKNGRFAESIETLSEGIKHFEQSQTLHICLGISHMNLGQHETALSVFLKFKNSADAIYHIANCYQALGEDKKAALYLDKIQATM